MKRGDLKVVTKRAPSEKEIDDLLFAWTVCKHTKSNAIIYVSDRQTVGVGAGQMSRVGFGKAGRDARAVADRRICFSFRRVLPFS